MKEDLTKEDLTRDSDAVFSAKVRAETMKMLEEIEKIRAETRKLQGESRWYPFVVCSGLILGALGLLKLIL